MKMTNIDLILITLEDDCGGMLITLLIVMMIFVLRHKLNGRRITSEIRDSEDELSHQLFGMLSVLKLPGCHRSPGCL